MGPLGFSAGLLRFQPLMLLVLSFCQLPASYLIGSSWHRILALQRARFDQSQRGVYEKTNVEKYMYEKVKPPAGGDIDEKLFLFSFGI